MSRDSDQKPSKSQPNTLEPYFTIVSPWLERVKFQLALPFTYGAQGVQTLSDFKSDAKLYEVKSDRTSISTNLYDLAPGQLPLYDHLEDKLPSPDSKKFAMTEINVYQKDGKTSRLFLSRMPSKRHVQIIKEQQIKKNIYVFGMVCHRQNS